MTHVVLYVGLQDVGHELRPGGHCHPPRSHFPRHLLLTGQIGVSPLQLQGLGQLEVESVGDLEASHPVSVGGQQSLYGMSHCQYSVSESVRPQTSAILDFTKDNILIGSSHLLENLFCPGFHVLGHFIRFCLCNVYKKLILQRRLGPKYLHEEEGELFEVVM